MTNTSSEIKEISVVNIKKGNEVQVILGHAGFIKTILDLYEAMVASVPNIKFGIAFAEASGPCLVRMEGNDETLKLEAERNMMQIGAGHSFIILFKNGKLICTGSNTTKNIKEVLERATKVISRFVISN